MKVKIVDVLTDDDGIVDGYTINVDGREYRARFNVRSDLGLGIKKHWLGRETSHIGQQYLDLQDGRVVKGRYLIERTDVIVVQGELINTFVEVNGYIDVQPWERDETSPASLNRAKIAGEIAFKRAKNDGYIANEKRFFDEKPWLRCHGRTVRGAIRILKPYAWQGVPVSVAA